MDALDLALFIGSSSEGVAIARELQAEVDQQCEPTVWSQDVFQPGGTTLSDLLTAADNTDFAALALTPDDSAVSRGDQKPAARDNVIFELGLFLGALGPRRVFIIRLRGQALRLPSDLAGITVLDYNANRKDGNFGAAMVARNGNRYSFPVGSPAETRDRLRPFTQQFAGAGLRLSQLVLKPVNEETGR